MSDINEIKAMLTEELKWFPTLADDRIFQAAISLLTTIESQNSQIESLKAITELAVNALKQIANEHYGSANAYSWQQLTKSTLSEIRELQNAQT